MNAQHEAEHLHAKLTRLRQTSRPNRPISHWLAMAELAVSQNCLANALHATVHEFRPEFTVRTRYHGDAEWRKDPNTESALMAPLWKHSGEAIDYGYAHNAKDRQISLELLAAGLIAVHKRLYKTCLVETALEMVK